MPHNDLHTRCFYCEQDFLPSSYGSNRPHAQTRDHIIPLSKGGVNHPRNMVYACSPCNHWKGDLTLDEFISKVNEFIRLKKTYKAIPFNKLFVIVEKARELISYVEKHENNLYKPFVTAVEVGLSKRNTTFYDGNDGEFHVVLRKPIIEKSLEREEVAANPVMVDEILYAKEYRQYLQQQTLEQFRIAKRHGWRFARAITGAEPNFHYE